MDQDREQVTSAELLISDGEAGLLVPHPLRPAIPAGVHAGPFIPIEVPARFLHFAFDPTGPRTQADRAQMMAFFVARSLPPPLPTKRHHRVPFGTTVLRREQHSEFTIWWTVNRIGRKLIAGED